MQLVNIGLIINDNELFWIIMCYFFMSWFFQKSFFGVIIYNKFNMIFLEFIRYIQVEEDICVFNFLEEFFVVF